MFQKFFMTALIILVAFGCIEKKKSLEDELNDELKGLGVQLKKVDPKKVKENMDDMKQIYGKEKGK